MMIKGPLVCSGRVFDIEIVKHFLKFKENKCIHKDDKKNGIHLLKLSMEINKNRKHEYFH